MLTTKLLRYLQQHKHRSQANEVAQVGHALLMLGVRRTVVHTPADQVMIEVGSDAGILCDLSKLH